MGEEITSAGFSDEDFLRFDGLLADETRLLADWLQAGRFSDPGFQLGFELELWIVDATGRPVPRVTELIERAGCPDMVPELAAFNLELNADPVSIEPCALQRMQRELQRVWDRARASATGLDCELAMIGMLPTLQPDDLIIENMSPLQRYRALNAQVFRLRAGKPLQIDICGRDRLQLELENVMLESATTSLQLHLKTPLEHSARAFNLAKMLSAPAVAISANSPLLFGRSLWEETRIPVFEQAIDVGASDLTRRVTFGIRYVEQSLLEVFEANWRRYPVMLPSCRSNADPMAHLRLHNGTIWRWNRPLIGYCDGVPHFRIEHRVMPAGPTPLDCCANAALFFGCVRALLEEPELEQRLPFAVARENFYRAAQHGLESQLKWLDGESIDCDELVGDRLVPLAREGLQQWGLEKEDIDELLGIISDRAESGRTGAHWQRTMFEQLGGDCGELMRRYLANQNSGQPVHLWSDDAD